MQQDRSTDKGTPSQVIVKWKSPTEELMGMAKVVKHLLSVRATTCAHLRLVAPSLLWARQMQQAAKSIGLTTYVFTPTTLLSERAQAALATLAYLAQADGAEVTPKKMSRESCTRTFFEQYHNAKGLSLIRACGMNACAELQGVVVHVQGNEDARALYALATEQLARPTVPANVDGVPIVLPVQNTDMLDYVLVFGCVEGLILAESAQGSRAIQSAKAPQDTSGAQDTKVLHVTSGVQDAKVSQEAFDGVVKSAQKRAFMSYFTSIDEDIAHRAHLQYARCKTQDGIRVAMTKPASVLDAWKSQHISTESGQALLGQFGLN